MNIHIIMPNRTLLLSVEAYTCLVILTSILYSLLHPQYIYILYTYLVGRYCGVYRMVRAFAILLRITISTITYSLHCLARSSFNVISEFGKKTIRNILDQKLFIG